MKVQIIDLREALHNLLKKEILESSLDAVADKYGINKTDRATLVKNEYDGKFSKFVEIVNAKGLEIVLRDPTVVDAEEVSEQINDIKELENDIANLNLVIIERDDKIKNLINKNIELEEELNKLKGNLAPEPNKNLTDKDVKPMMHKPLSRKELRERGVFDSDFYGKHPKSF